MPAYNPLTYWSRVACEIGSRTGDNVIAGDDIPFYRYQRAMFVRHFLRAMPVEGKAVLEVGCGPGGNLSELTQRHPRRLVGCDISKAMLDIATRRSGAQIEYVETNGKTLPFRDNEFDLTFTVTVLQHNPDAWLEILLPEVCRVTDKMLFLFEPTSVRKVTGDSWFVRRVDDYATRCARHGFELHDTAFLKVKMSERICLTLNGRLNPRTRKEGEPVTAASSVAQRLVLPVTAMLDGLIDQHEGLTKMVFHRRA